MLFLFRSTVCLGLVFWAIPAVQPDGRSANSTIAGIAATSGAGVTRTFNNYCNSNPAVCLQIASKLASSGKDVSMQTVQTLARTMLAAHSPASQGISASASTLTASDMAIPARR